MNSFYEITEYLRKKIENIKEVNTLKFSSQDQSDLNKKDIYPLVYINPMSAPSTRNTSVVAFTFEIAALDQRDQSNLTNLTDKFTGNDNLIDNLNITHAILNKLYIELESDLNDSGIEIENISSMTPIFTQQVNLLDGWFYTITLKMKNVQC